MRRLCMFTSDQSVISSGNSAHLKSCQGFRPVYEAAAWPRFYGTDFRTFASIWSRICLLLSFMCCSACHADCRSGWSNLASSAGWWRQNRHAEINHRDAIPPLRWPNALCSMTLPDTQSHVRSEWVTSYCNSWILDAMSNQAYVASMRLVTGVKSDIRSGCVVMG